MRCYILLLFCMGCAGSPYSIDAYTNVTAYSINYTKHTSSGIGVDGALDSADIDKRTDEVESCLTALYPSGELPQDVVQASSCIGSVFNPHIARQYIGVKLAPDWFRGCYAEDWSYVGPGLGEEMFPANVDAKLCEVKGFTITAECPCGARAMIQDDSAIVTAPNMHLYKSELIRLVTGCNNIWTSALATCYTD